MASFNKVILMGNLTRDPELKYLPSGQGVCSFSIALNNRYTSNGETKEDVSYIDIVVFGKQAENCNQYIARGRSVIVEGRLQQRRWESQDGQKRSKVEVVAQGVTFMPRSAGQNAGGGYQDSYQGGGFQGDSSASSQQKSDTGSEPENAPVNLNVPF